MAITEGNKRHQFTNKGCSSERRPGALLVSSPCVRGVPVGSAAPLCGLGNQTILSLPSQGSLERG